MSIPTELEYLKKQFLKNSQLIINYCEPMTETQKSIQQFQKLLNNTLVKIPDIDNIDDFKASIQTIRKDFLSTWNTVHNNKGPENELMRSYYFSSKINLPDDWLKQEQQLYQDKNISQFFNKCSFALKNIFKMSDNLKINVKKTDPLLIYENIEKLSSDIITIYNLSSIDLSNAKSPQEALKFLLEFDKKASVCFDKLGTSPEIFGLNQTLSLKILSPSSNSAGMFYPSECAIYVKPSALQSNLLLHEWVHALDCYICIKHTGQHKFTSNQEVNYIDEDSPSSKAYKAIKELTQQIFNYNKDVVEQIKTEKLQEGASKFWSQILGDSWYGISEESRQNLLSKESVRKINNYLVVQDTKTVSELLSCFDTLRTTDKIPHHEAINNLNNNQEFIKSSIKPFFDDVNKNLISQQSLYYVSSYLSNGMNALNTFLLNGFRKTKALFGVKIEENLGNGEDSNYFVQPMEMLARYFEGQLFPVDAVVYNLTSLVPAYKFNKDKNFEENKNNIISHVFGKDKILANVNKIRDSSTSSNSNLKIV